VDTVMGLEKEGTAGDGIEVAGRLQGHFSSGDDINQHLWSIQKTLNLWCGLLRVVS
jgi:hypothetical protein